MKHRRRSTARATAVALFVAMIVSFAPSAAHADTLIPISGTGSTWAQNVLDQWRRDVALDFGMTVNYAGVGSSAGRRDFIAQSVDFAVSEMPFQADPEDGSAHEVPTTSYTYVPLVAGGTALAYNLIDANSERVTGLRLSEATIAGIFTGGIRFWNDPAIVAENPEAALPAKAITPVVRSDGSGSTLQFTSWLKARQPARWNTMCANDDDPSPSDCPATSQFPVLSFMKAQNGSLGVAGYMSQSYAEGAITYVENSYALNSGLPVTKVLNAGGYYVAPTSGAVSIALLGADIDTLPSSPDRGTLRLAGVYTNPHPRAYPLSSATYMIVPTEPTNIFTADKGATLSAFTQYALCAGQRRASDLGYAALPLNLVQSAFAELSDVPGATTQTLNGCDNPTFVAGDTASDTLLTRTASMPPESDRADGVSGDSCAPTGGAGEIGLCATTIPAVDEPLSLELPAEAAAAFEEPRLMNGRSLTVGELPEITVTDGRVVSHPGWDLLATVADFYNAADETIVISSVDTGLRPVVVGGDRVTAGAGEVAGSAAYPTVFASAETGSGVGDTTLGGEVSLLSPPDRPAGTYRSSMTLTLVSR